MDDYGHWPLLIFCKKKSLCYKRIIKAPSEKNRVAYVMYRNKLKKILDPKSLLKWTSWKLHNYTDYLKQPMQSTIGIELTSPPENIPISNGLYLTHSEGVCKINLDIVGYLNEPTSALLSTLIKCSLYSGSAQDCLKLVKVSLTWLMAMPLHASAAHLWKFSTLLCFVPDVSPPLQWYPSLDSPLVSHHAKDIPICKAGNNKQIEICIPISNCHIF